MSENRGKRKEILKIHFFVVVIIWNDSFNYFHFLSWWESRLFVVFKIFKNLVLSSEEQDILLFCHIFFTDERILSSQNFSQVFFSTCQVSTAIFRYRKSRILQFYFILFSLFWYFWTILRLSLAMCSPQNNEKVYQLWIVSQQVDLMIKQTYFFHIKNNSLVFLGFAIRMISGSFVQTSDIESFW